MCLWLKRLIKKLPKIKIGMIEKPKKANLLLIRDTFSEKSTIGKIYLNGEFMSYSLELSWRDNRRNISCIPDGKYSVRLRTAKESATRDYLHLLVQDVPDRGYILMHIGNYASSDWPEGDKTDTKGCILTGCAIADKPDTIWESKVAHTALLNTLIEEEIAEDITLTIKNR